MELDEMRALWNATNETLLKQQKLTNKLIMTMTQRKFDKKINIISKTEGIGSVICIAIGLLLLFNITKLQDTWYLLASGIFISLFYLVFPFISLASIRRMKQIDIASKTFKETLIHYAKRKEEFLFVQRIGIVCGMLVVILGIPVASKLLSNKDLYQGSDFTWLITMVGGLIFLFFFGRWGYGCYKGITDSAENIINNLDTND